MRDHEGQKIDAFNGLFDRGDHENTPIDHFQGSNNIRHQGKSVMTRDGIVISQSVNAQVPLQNIRRIYNYPMLTKNTLIVLSYDPNTNTGNIYHVVDSTSQFGPVLSITGMTDFAFLPFSGRAYISPFSSLLPGLPAPVTAPTLMASGTTGIDPGLHYYAVTFVTAVGETNQGVESSINITNSLIDPVSPLDISTTFGTNSLTPGATYSWVVTFVDGSSNETLPSSPSTSYIAQAGQGYHTQGYGSSQTPSPGTVTVNIYRTLGNGSTYFLEQSVSVGNYTTIPIYVGNLSDAAISGNANPPTTNTSSVIGIVDLTSIPIGGSSVIARKIYRSKSGETQLKLLTTINDNITTIYTDTTLDSALGANVPTSNTAIIPGEAVEKGLAGEFLYVYAGDGTNARKAAGSAITGSMTIAAGSGGTTDKGLHIYGVVSETISGYLTPPGALTTFTNTGTSISFGSIPTSGDPNVIKRHLVASKAINNFNGDTEGYDLFFIPSGTINNNTDTFLNNVSFFDADLLEDASHLFDNYSEIPAGAFLTSYHGRLVLGATYDDFNLVIVSAEGEPEAINQIDGILATQPNGYPCSNGAEFRDVLYIFKPNSSMSFTDNGDVPSSWPLVEMDAALGTRCHGISAFLNSATQSVDFLIIATYQGISLFTGAYQTPELSWKIESFWRALSRDDFGKIQIVNNAVKKRIYVVLPNRFLLVGFFQNGINPKDIQWEPWTFVQPVNTVAVTNIDTDIIGCDIFTS